MLLFVTPILVFAVILGVIFTHLYGSPLRSGYGAASDLFAIEHVVPNLARYPRWLVERQGPLVLLFVIPLFWWRGEPHVRVVLLAFIALTYGCYLPYLNFEAWWFLRFLLPAFPAIFILAASAASQVGERTGGRWRHAALPAFAAIVMGYGL